MDLIRVEREYFEWMCDVVCRDRFNEDISYQKLLLFLHNTTFTWTVKKDANRAADGISLRRHFSEHIYGPCSVLEMMVALAIRFETDIMQDTTFGDRTAQWFWRMIVNLGLGDMRDDQFDEEYVWSCINVFLNRDYEPNGQGGLFTIKNTKHDLRKVEIWVQLLWFSNSIA